MDDAPTPAVTPTKPAWATTKADLQELAKSAAETARRRASIEADAARRAAEAAHRTTVLFLRRLWFATVIGGLLSIGATIAAALVISLSGQGAMVDAFYALIIFPPGVGLGLYWLRKWDGT